MWNAISLPEIMASTGLDLITVVPASPEIIEEMRTRAQQGKPRPLSQREELVLRERTVEDLAPREPLATTP